MPSDRLYAGQSLLAGQWLESSSGIFRLMMEAGGNFGIHIFSINPIAHSYTWGAVEDPIPGSHITVSPYGYFQLINPSGGQVGIWGINASPHESAGVSLLMQDDGHLVLYGPGTDAVVLFATPPETVLNDSQQFDLVVPGALLLEIDQSSYLSEPFDKTVVNQTNNRIIIRDVFKRIIIGPGGQTGIRTVGGNLSIGGMTYNFPDEIGAGSVGNVTASQNYAPGVNLIKVTESGGIYSLS